MASTQFPDGDGVFYVSCEKTDYRSLYPEACEIRQRADTDLFSVPPVLNVSAPPEDLDTYAKNLTELDPIPSNNLVEGLHGGLQDWKEPLDAEWHAKRDNKFTDKAFQETVQPIESVPLEKTMEEQAKKMAEEEKKDGAAPAAAPPPGDDATTDE